MKAEDAESSGRTGGTGLIERLEALRSVAAAQGLEAVRSAAGPLLEALRFPAYIFAIEAIEQGRVRSLVLVCGGHFTGKEARVEERWYGALDALTQRFYEQDHPFSLREMVATMPVTRSARGCLAMLEHVGATDCGHVPIAVEGTPYRARFSVSSAEEEPEEGFRRRFREQVPFLRLLGLVFLQPALPLALEREHGSLTASEREVLSSAARGMRNREIARHLGKSEHTVRNQLDAARARLGARTLAEAVGLAVRYGLIRPGSAD
ncbi:MAG: helix-turn-helix transcriptional regulator [Pseudomonadota bacterium]